MEDADSGEEFSIFSNSSHLEWRADLSDTILKGTHPGTIPARFGFIWLLLSEQYNISELLICLVVAARAI
jgi:hypothetical protein